jgi:hypothetical protein
MEHIAWAETRFGMPAVGTLPMAVAAAYQQKPSRSDANDAQGGLDAWSPPV